MKRLISSGLMFGGLVPVESPALIERYNRALKSLVKKETKLKDFHIDLSGFSPEIADELDDPLYLNPKGANRKFILLSTDQKDAPLLNQKFSTHRDILSRFIAANETALFALTARDAVAGELEDTVYDVTTPDKLFEMTRVTVIADTTGSHIAEAGKLKTLIDRFRSEEDGWYDDVLIAEMIETARKTGDVVRNPVTLSATTYDQRDFWTSHFGGIYVFQSVEHPAAITVEPAETLGGMPVRYVFDLLDRNQIAKFLELNGLVEPIVVARGADAAAILRQKMDFILVDAAAALGLDVTGADRRALRNVASTLGERLPPEFQGLLALLRYVEAGGPWPRITSAHPSYFYTLRAAAGPHRDLVNMLLSELSPLDVRQLFICHKELFYRLYSGWSDPKKAYVVDFLVREYQVDRQGVRDRLFGPEPGMGAGDVGATVGPWGAVARARR
jgi:hypothetical protein